MILTKPDQTLTTDSELTGQMESLSQLNEHHSLTSRQSYQQQNCVIWAQMPSNSAAVWSDLLWGNMELVI